MRTKFKAWAEPYIKEHPEIALTDEELGKLDGFCLEIGSGKGDFLVSMATKFPNIKFVGVERNVTCAGFSAKKIVESKLENIRFLWSDVALVTPKLKDKSVDTIFLNFSDPWPKKRHAKRRLTFTTFLNHYYRILKKGGKIIFKSDNDGLYEYTAEEFLNTKFELVTNEENYIFDEESDAMTEYERKFRDKGQHIHRIIAVK